jgi:hypothetical protein
VDREDRDICEEALSISSTGNPQRRLEHTVILEVRVKVRVRVRVRVKG